MKNLAERMRPLAQVKTSETQEKLHLQNELMKHFDSEAEILKCKGQSLDKISFTQKKQKEALKQ